MTISDAESIGQCPEGTPSIIYKSDFKKSTAPKLENKERLEPDLKITMIYYSKSTGSICVNYSYALYSEIEDENER